MHNVTSISKGVDDGRHGTYRLMLRPNERNTLDVETDEEAVAKWIETLRSKETVRSYRREINRLSFWCYNVVRKPISSLGPNDYQDYAKFLAAPPAQWCGKGKLFKGPFSEKNQRHAFDVIKSLLRFLHEENYLQKIAMRKNLVIARPSVDERRREIEERQLDEQQLNTLLYWFDTNQTVDAKRARFAAYLTLHLGLRISEVATHKMSDFRCFRGEWRFLVTGKGRKYAELPVSPELLNELKRFREWVGLPKLPAPNEEHKLILDTSKTLIGIGDRRIRQILKDAVVAASDLLEDGESKRTMRACSPHWFRHMFIATLANMNLPDEDVQKLARHSKIETTFLYRDSIRKRRHAAVQSLAFQQDLSGE